MSGPESDRSDDYRAFLSMLREEWRNGCDTSAFVNLPDTYFKNYDNIPLDARNRLVGYAYHSLRERQQALKDAARIIKGRIAKDERQRERLLYYSAIRSKVQIAEGTRLFTEAEREEASLLESAGLRGSSYPEAATLYSTTRYVGPSRGAYNNARKKYGLPPLAKEPQTAKSLIGTILAIALWLTIAGFLIYGATHPASHPAPTPCYSAEEWRSP